MTNLKPCPFCGGDAERITLDDDEYENAGGDVIQCQKCLASSRVEFGFKENLVSAWNTRAAIEAPDHLSLVAAAYRDAAERCGAHSYSNNYFVSKALHDAATGILARTPADADAHLTALLRVEYERGVREAFRTLRETVSKKEAEERILALLTQEGR